MHSPPLMQRISSRFESLVVIALQLLMMLVIGIAIFELIQLMYTAILAHPLQARPLPAGETAHIGEIDTVLDLQRALQRAFGGVLLVLLGLELLDTLRTYFNEHQ